MKFIGEGIGSSNSITRGCLRVVWNRVSLLTRLEHGHEYPDGRSPDPETPPHPRSPQTTIDRRECSKARQFFVGRNLDLHNGPGRGGGADGSFLGGLACLGVK